MLTHNRLSTPLTPGVTVADPIDGITATDEHGHCLTVAPMGGDRLDVLAGPALRLNTATVRAFATALLGLVDYIDTRHPTQPSTGREQPAAGPVTRRVEHRGGAA